MTKRMTPAEKALERTMIDFIEATFQFDEWSNRIPNDSIFAGYGLDDFGMGDKEMDKKVIQDIVARMNERGFEIRKKDSK